MYKGISLKKIFISACLRLKSEGECIKTEKTYNIPRRIHALSETTGNNTMGDHEPLSFSTIFFFHIYIHVNYT